MPTCTWREITSVGLTWQRTAAQLLALGALVLGLGWSAVAFAQSSTGAWPADVELKRSTVPQDASPGAWGTSATSTPTKPIKPAGKGRITFTAHLTQDGEPIDQGLIWRVFSMAEATGGQARAPTPSLVGSWTEATPQVELQPGSYYVNVAYGRAHLTRRITVAGGPEAEERFVLNAGGLRVTCHLAGGEKLPTNSVTYDIYEGDTDQLAGRKRVVAGLRPGTIVRLNAGLYHLVSTVGDANAVVSADVTVEAGKLTDAVLSHHAARVTLKLVTRAGGEALADTIWAVHTDQGELVRESQGALPSHFLAAGNYVASARHSGQLYQRQFAVEAGAPVQVEVVIP